jgi:ankyrin repeat protein
MTRALIIASFTALLSFTPARADLFDAAAAGDTTRVLQFVEMGINVDTTDAEGNTPLMWAVGYGHADVVRLLIGAGADVNAAGRIGNTALLLSAQTGATESARLLIDAGATATANDYGTTPEALARGYGHVDMLELLRTAPLAGHQVALAF